MQDEAIYHITTRDAWDQAREAGVYAAPSLQDEGFIHCSTRGQVPSTTERYFAGIDDVIVLCVDTSLLRSEVRYEDTAGHGDVFPHIYGPLDLVAVHSVVAIGD